MRCSASCQGRARIELAPGLCVATFYGCQGGIRVGRVETTQQPGKARRGLCRCWRLRMVVGCHPRGPETELWGTSMACARQDWRPFAHPDLYRACRSDAPDQSAQIKE